MSVNEMLRLAWTYQGPKPVGEPGEPEQWAIRIRELPGFLAAGGTSEEAIADLRPALQAFLTEMVAQGIDFEKPDPRLWQYGPPLQIVMAHNAPRSIRDTSPGGNAVPALDLVGALHTV